MGVSHPMARHYLDLLTGAFMVRQLQPWFANVGKRIVKTPKVYLRDSGILHVLLNIPTLTTLQSHPKLGASWEGFVVEQIVVPVGERNCYYWATHAGAELDLLVLWNRKRWGFEFKYQDAPTMTKSMYIALTDLRLERLWVVYPGPTAYPLHKKVECIGLREMGKRLPWRR